MARCTWAGKAGVFGFNGDGQHRLDTELYWTMDMRFAADGTVAEAAQFLGRVGGAGQLGVVHQKRHAIGAEFDVAFKHPVAVLRAQAKSRQRVFGRQFAGATVCDPARVGPGRQVGGGDVGHGLSRRFPVLASNRCSRSARGVAQMLAPTAGAGVPSFTRRMSRSSCAAPCASAQRV